uniref:Uncharacterized protein n=1 Tax=Cajanus cajan TaxID=3821 RepID=A0A151U003_CAJCA|nr:hypothetical protein KK1_005216 [Cajanus cajan]
MDLPPEIDEYIRETIDHSLGLPVSSQTLHAKLHASQESQRQLRQQHLFLLSKLKEKDQLIERARSEASMNAQAVKRFVAENQKLAVECENLVEQCVRLEKECKLYEHDREALMEFGNEAEDRAQEANARLHELEQELIKYKHQNESIDSFSTSTLEEDNLLESLLATVTTKDESSACGFLNAYSENEHCKKLLTMWNCLKPSIRTVLCLIAEIKSLENDKENLRVNLDRAEEEVKVLFEENSVLDEENKRLAKRCKERNHSSSGGKHTDSASAKSNKRKSSPKTCSPMAKKIDFEDVDSARTPLSPLGNKLSRMPHV